MLVPRSISNKSMRDKIAQKDHTHDHTPPLQQEPSNSCSSHDTIIANHNQVSTYISQVTGNHPTSTSLSMAKQYFWSQTKIGFEAYLWDKEKVYMQQVFHSTPIT
jgi:hypothetical protein